MRLLHQHHKSHVLGAEVVDILPLTAKLICKSMCVAWLYVKWIVKYVHILYTFSLSIVFLSKFFFYSIRKALYYNAR